jgi:hypothetical protein
VADPAHTARRRRLDNQGHFAFALVCLLSSLTFVFLHFLHVYPGGRATPGAYLFGMAFFGVAFVAFAGAALLRAPQRGAGASAPQSGAADPGKQRRLAVAGVATFWLLAAIMWALAIMGVTLRLSVEPVVIAVPLTWLPLTVVAALRSSPRSPGPREMPGSNE